MEQKTSSSTSGYAKRKKKREAEETLKRELKKVPKLTKFFSSSTVKESSLNCYNQNVEHYQETIELPVSAISQNEEISTLADDTTGTENEAMLKEEITFPAMSPVDSYVNSPESEFDFESLMMEENPTDMGHFTKIISSGMKRFIVNHGSCRPKGPFPQDAKKRSFSETFYKKRTKAGFELETLWLCYSAKLNKVYCEPCWLFSSALQASGWKTGISDWQGLSKKIKEHENSAAHTEACYAKELWRRNKCLDEEMEKELRKESKFWRKVLWRLMKITIKLAKNASPFRGHREKLDDVYNGNFLSDVILLAEFDDVMREVINLPSGSTKYLSPIIQNEIIECLGSYLHKQLASEIREAPFFSIIADSTQDISKSDQLCIMYRYVKVVRNERMQPTDINVNEVFMGFTEIKDQTAKGISSSILDDLWKNNIDLKNCRGQSYDGANTMSGVYTGVQTRLKEIQPNAFYVHCAAHCLNLVVNDAVRDITEIRNCFTVVQDIYLFLGMSLNRWNLLACYTGESVVTIKRLNPTRWAGRLISLVAIQVRYADILKVLTRLILESKKKDEMDEAKRIKKKMEEFEFVFTLITLIKILSSINLTSKLLQRQQVDLGQAIDHLEYSCNEMKDLRNQFKSVKTEATSIAEKWGIVPALKDKRLRKVKKHFDELAEDHRFSDVESYYKVTVFYKAIDIVSSQLESRFEGMKKVGNLFLFLKPGTLLSLSENAIKEKSLALHKTYPDDLSEALSIQLLLCVKTLKSEIEKIDSIRDLAELIIVKYSDMSSSFSDVCSLLILFLTIPVTVASAERSFSKLKIIKTYLRNRMGQERLSSLSSFEYRSNNGR